MFIYEKRPSKMTLFWLQGFFSENFISEMGVKMNLRIMTKSYAADPEIGFPTKSILQPFGLMCPFRQFGS